MTRAPSLMSSQPPDLQDAVMQAAETQTYGEIQEWLNVAGIPANYTTKFSGSSQIKAAPAALNGLPPPPITVSGCGNTWVRCWHTSKALRAWLKW